MSNKISLKNMAAELLKAERIFLFTHIQPDGDCLGSAFPICAALRALGKQAVVLMDEPIPEYLRFLDDQEDSLVMLHPLENNQLSAFLEDAKEKHAAGSKRSHSLNDEEKNTGYLSLSVDSSSDDRFESLKEIFYGGKPNLCLDHHKTNTYFAEKTYMKSCAATAQLAYQLLKELAKQTGKRPEELITPQMATCLYTGIVTDTGEFEYSNTTPETHRIAASLMELGADFQSVTVEVYQSDRPEKILLQSEIMAGMRLFEEGKAVIASVSQEMLHRNGCTMSETEGVVEKLRSVRGAEVSVFIKEVEEGLCRASTRSKNYLDVAAICQSFGGGGHTRAAGCTLHMTVAEAAKTMEAAVSAQFAKQDR